MTLQKIHITQNLFACPSVEGKFRYEVALAIEANYVFSEETNV